MIAMPSIAPTVPGLSPAGSSPAEDASTAAAFGAVMASLTPPAGPPASPLPATPVTAPQPAVIARGAGDDAPADTLADDDAATAEGASDPVAAAMVPPTVMVLPIVVPPVLVTAATPPGEGIHPSAATPASVTGPMAGIASGRAARPGGTPLGITPGVALPRPLTAADAGDGAPGQGIATTPGAGLDTSAIAPGDSSPDGATIDPRPVPRGVAVSGARGGVTPGSPASDRATANDAVAGGAFLAGQAPFAATPGTGAAAAAGSRAASDRAGAAMATPQSLMAVGGVAMMAAAPGDAGVARAGGDAVVLATGTPSADATGTRIADVAGTFASNGIAAPAADPSVMPAANAIGTLLTGATGAPLAAAADVIGMSLATGDGMSTASDARGTMPAGLSITPPGASNATLDAAPSPRLADRAAATTAMTGLDLDAMFPLACTAPLTVSFPRAPHPVALSPVAETVAAGDPLVDLARIDDDTAALLPAGLVIAMPAPATPAGDAATGPAAAAALADAGIRHHLDVAHDGAWLDRLAHDIAASADLNQKMRFQLNPERLGALHVEIAGGSDGASVRFTADSEAARALLADAQPRLVAEARAQGMRIADTQVDLSGRNGGQGGGQGGGANPFAQGQQQGGGQRAPLFDRPVTNRRSTRAGAVTAGAERYA